MRGILAVLAALAFSGPDALRAATSDTLRLRTSLVSDSSGVFDTLRQSAAYFEVTDSVVFITPPRDTAVYYADYDFSYRWTLVSYGAAVPETLLDSVTAPTANDRHRLRLVPLEDGTYSLHVSIADSGYEMIPVYPDSVGFAVHTTYVPLAGNRWQMVALARRAPDPTAATLLGGRGFWSFHWHEAAGDEDGNYVNYASRAFERGLSYWVRLEGEEDMPMNLVGSTADSSDTVAMTLLEGWNQVANPFGYAVAWDSAYTRNAAGAKEKIGPSPAEENKPRGVFAWDMDAGSYSLHEAGGDAIVALMEPWRGYWLYADRAMTVYLPPTPYFAMVHPGTAVAAGKASAGEGWRVTLSARQAGAADRCCILGVAPDADAGYGFEDLYKPAPMDPAVRMDLADGLARDIRPTGGTRTWDVALTASGNGPVTVAWDGASGVPAGCGLYLYDTGSGTVTDMKQSVSYVVAGGSAALRVIASDDPAFSPDVLGSELRIVSAGALPCSGPVEIAFTVPAAAVGGTAALTVFGTGGRAVARVEASAAAGRVCWDGTDAAGDAVAAGAYPYLLRVGAEQVCGMLLKAE